MEMVLARLGVNKSPTLSALVRHALRLPFRAARRVRTVLDKSRRPAPLSTAEIILAIRPIDALPFARYRARNLQLCTSVFDEIIAVSRRTRDVLVEKGVPAAKVSVSYIGTAHQSRFSESRRRMDIGNGLHLAYLGYMRRDKGFYFFLDCLENMPRELSSRIAVTIAARATDHGALERLRKLGPLFRSFTLFNGYTHATLDSVLENVNLGVVPVLWEDNLPQVAIEMVCHGIPLLTSDRGGAQEIGSDKAFVFAAGSRASFYDRLRALADGRTELRRFWAMPPKLVSNQEHVEELIQLYSPSPPPFRQSA